MDADGKNDYVTLAWAQFTKLRAQAATSSTGPSPSIESEQAFLTNQVKTKKWNHLHRERFMLGAEDDLVAYTNTYFESMEHTHTCSSDCGYAHMVKGKRYRNNGREYIATGDVYVCNTSAKVHLCRSRCMNSCVLLGGEGLVCTLTGNMIGDEYSISDVTTGSDVRLCGQSIFRHFGMRNDSAPAANTSQHDILSRLMAVCSSTMKDASYVLGKLPNANFDALAEMCKKRTSWRNLAISTFARMVSQGQYTGLQECGVQDAHSKWVQHCAEYYANCARKGHKVDLIKLVLLWASIERPAYKGMTIGGDPHAVARRLRDKIVEAVIRLWERLSTLKTARTKNTQFGNCLLGMLQYMEDEDGGGLSTQLAVLHDGKPIRPSALSARMRGDVHHYIEMEFIPRVPGLKLAQPRQVREKNPSRKRRRGITGVLDSVSLVNPQRGAGCRIKKKTPRKKSDVSSQMPSKKTVAMLFTDAITEAATVEELHSYCVSSLIDLQSSD